MAVDIWWYEERGQWCADVPAAEGRKRLYLGSNETGARAELQRYMAQYCEDLGEEARDSRPAVRDSRGGPSLLDLAVRSIRWNQANRAHGTWRTYRNGLKHITRVDRSKLANELKGSNGSASTSTLQPARGTSTCAWSMHSSASRRAVTPLPSVTSARYSF